MTESTTATPGSTSVEPTEPKPTWFQVQRAKHPRLSKALTVTVGGLAAVGVVQTARTMKANKHKLESAGEHVQEAASDIASSVTPQSPEA